MTDDRSIRSLIRSAISSASQSTIRSTSTGAMNESASQTSRLDVELLMSHVLSKSRAWLIAHDDLHLDETTVGQFEVAVARRRAGEPIAYILGYRYFWNRRFEVGPGCLVPRPETELLVEIALAALSDRPATLLDLGAGSGAVGISLAAERPRWSVIACDLYEDALIMTTANCTDIPNLFCCRGNWGEALGAASFDLVVCNPPYIAAEDPHLAGLSAEPMSALIAGTDGLDDIRRVVADAVRILKSGGMLVMEHGHEQRESVVALLKNAGYADIRTFDDLDGTPRAVRATRT